LIRLPAFFKATCGVAGVQQLVFDMFHDQASIVFLRVASSLTILLSPAAETVRGKSAVAFAAPFGLCEPSHASREAKPLLSFAASSHSLILRARESSS